MRGLAAAIMLQGHVFEGWVRPEDRSSEWFWFSQFLGGLPAPIFLFLVGVSLAIVLDRLRAKGAPARELVSKVLRRGGWVLLLAYAFRVEQYLMWYPDSRWSDVFRVDTLNCIAVSTLIIGLASVAFRTRRVNIGAMAAATALVVFLTPFIYPIRSVLPDAAMAYLNGNGNGSLFSIFPWIAFALAGMTFGYLLQEWRERSDERELFRRVAVAGICFFAAGTAMRLTPAFEYGFFDYSLTSPHFFLVRLGYLCLILAGAYHWSQRPDADRWSSLRVMGQASLIVYWAHIELVYGRLFHHYSRSLTLAGAARHLFWVFPLMIGMAVLWQRWQGASASPVVMSPLASYRAPMAASGLAPVADEDPGCS